MNSPAASIRGTPIPGAGDVQYQQRVDESVYVNRPQLVPGLRGRARSMQHFGDPLTERPIGGFLQINNGYPFSYTASRVRTFAPQNSSTAVIGKGTHGDQSAAYRYRANRTQEFSTSRCN